MTARNFSRGRARAREIIRVLSIEDPSEIDVEDIAWHQGALVREEDLEGFEGRLLRTGRTGLIAVKQSIRESGKKRWVAAHELGHFELHEDTNQLALCTNRDLLYFYRKVQPTETEANEFASELLMPEALLKPRMESLTPSLEIASEISDAFRTTLTAAALRYVDACDFRCAVVMSKDSAVEWCHPSLDFGYWINRGTALSDNSYAADYFSGDPLPTSIQRVPATAWLSSDKIKGDATIKEHSWALGSYGCVLTLLWIEDDIDGAYEEEPEPELDPDYFTPDGKRWRF